MDTTAEAIRSQAVLDSIQDLILSQNHVVEAMGSVDIGGGAEVMVDVVPGGVAFMPGQIVSPSVLVGLGGNLYVERTSHQALEILLRRNAGTSLFSRATRRTQKSVVDSSDSSSSELYYVSPNAKYHLSFVRHALTKCTMRVQGAPSIISS